MRVKAQTLLVQGADPKVRSALVPDSGHAWKIAGLTGATLAVIGWMDVLLLWYPARFGTPEWEFATTSATIDALPLATLSLVVLSVATLARARRPWAPRALAVLFWLVALAVAAVAVLFALTLAPAARAIPDAMRTALKVGSAKTLICSAAYFSLYGVVGVLCWKRAGQVKRERSLPG